MGAACEVLHKTACEALYERERRCVRAVVRRGLRAAGAARVALRAQRHRCGVVVVSPSGLWVRARAGALVLVVCEDERADGDTAEDGDVEQSPCTWQRGMPMRSGARSGSDGSSSVEAGRRVGTSVKWRLLAQPPGSEACSTPRDLQYTLAEADASFKSAIQSRGTDGMVWCNGRGQVARSPTDASQATLIVTCHLVL